MVNKKCKVALSISRIPSSENLALYISTVSNEFCKIDVSGLFFKKSLNKILEKDYRIQTLNLVWVITLIII